MLEGLNKVEWSKLKHAYGSAEDAPDFIVKLLSTDADEREEAYEYLYSAIWHQGTVYEATAYVVPFLLEILTSPTFSRHEDLLGYLDTLVGGTSYSDTHQLMTSDNDIFSMYGSLENYALTMRNELEAAERVRLELSKGRLAYETFLVHPNVNIRKFSVRLLLNCFGEDFSVFDVLFSTLQRESNAEVQQALILGLGKSEVRNRAFLEYLLQPPDPLGKDLTRLTHLAALIFLQKNLTKPDSLFLASEFLRSFPEKETQEYPYEIQEAIAQALSKLHPRIATLYLLPALQSVNWHVCSDAASHLIHLNFPKNLIKTAKLTINPFRLLRSWFYKRLLMPKICGNLTFITLSVGDMTYQVTKRSSSSF